MRSVFAALLALTCATAVAAAGTDATPAWNGRFVDVRGSHLWVETKGSGAPLVFLHGGILYFDNNFVRQRDDFAASRQVIGIDRRGHGHSPDDARPFSYQDMADDMAAVIEQLGLGPVDVIGHSDGGNVGLILARDHPKLVRRLVVSGANLRPGLTPEQLEERRTRSPEQQDAALRRFSDRLPAYFRTDYEKTSPDGPERWWTFLAKSNRMWLTPLVIPAADLKTINTPVLVMAGDHDFTTIEETLEIYGNLPRGQLFILPATGHGTMSEQPELVNLAMREFLDRPDAPSKP